MDRPRRTHAQARAEMREGILRVGGELLAEHGPAGLSVREIARRLGVASSALYRHVADRDELLTLLLVDAYTDLADVVDAAVGRRRGRSGLAALAGALRGWAVRQPQRWALVYGTPVPGYEAPSGRTTAPGTRVMARFLALLASGEPDVAAVPAIAVPAPGPRYAVVLADGARELGVAASPELTADAVEAWTGLVGLVSAEVFGQLGPDFRGVGEEMLRRWVAGTSARFGLG